MPCSDHRADILDGAEPATIDLWAVHPGGRTVLDAVERAFALAPQMLAASRDVLRRYGNMSSATVMFVIETLLKSGARGAQRLRHGLRARADRGNHAVPHRGLNARMSPPHA